MIMADSASKPTCWCNTCTTPGAGSWAVEECYNGEGRECWWGVAFAAVGETEEEVVEVESARAGWA